MSTIGLPQSTAADSSNPALSAQDLADITAACSDPRPYVATHPSLYPAPGQWLADQGVVPAQPPAVEEPTVSEPEASVEETSEQAESSADGHEEAQPEAEAVPIEVLADRSAVEEVYAETPAEPEVVHVEPEAPVSKAIDDNLEQTILEGATQSEAPAVDEATPTQSTKEQVAQPPSSNPSQIDAQSQSQPEVGVQARGQSPFGAQPQQGQQAPFGQPGRPQYGIAPQQGQQGWPQLDAQPQQGQQAPFSQPGQPQYGTTPQQGQQGQSQFGVQSQQGQQAPPGQPGQLRQWQHGQSGYAPAGQSTDRQLGVAAQQFDAAASLTFNQFQTVVAAETGKVSGRSVCVTYSLIGIVAVAVLTPISMFLPYFSGYGMTASMFEVKDGCSAFHLILLIAVVGLGVVYWFMNQKWAFLSAGIGALVVALLGVIQFIIALSNQYVGVGFGVSLLALFSIVLGAAGGLPLMELKTGAVVPTNNPNAFGGVFAGVQMGQQQDQFGQQQGGFQTPQAGQPQFSQQQGGFQAPRAGQPQSGQQQGGFQAPQVGQPQYGQQQGGFQAPQAPQVGQPQFGQQQGQRPQLGDKPYNPLGPQV